MRQQPIPQLGLEPCALRRHDLPTIRYVKKLPDTHRIKTKGYLHLPAVNPLFQFGKPSDATHKIDPLVGSHILNAQMLFQDILLQDGNIQYADRISAKATLFGDKLVPAAIYIHPEFV